jgi:hypothetical protein
MPRLHLTLALLPLLAASCAGKASDGDEDDADGDGAGLPSTALWIAPGGATYRRVSDGALAWTVSASLCSPSGSGLRCTSELQLTGPVGRRCPDCADQDLSVDTVWAADGSASVERVELHAGDGLPLGVALSGVALTLLPEGPWAVGNPVAVGAEVDLPDEVVPVFARFILLSEGGAFTTVDDRTFSDCTLFAYAERDGEDVLAIAASCAGEGIVQAAFPRMDLEELDAIGPFAGISDRDLFVRD